MRHETELRFWRLPAHWVPGLVILFTLAVLAVTILLACWQLRLNVREQITRRDSQALYALWLTHFDEAEGSPTGPESAADQLWAILETSRLKHLKAFQAARLFDGDGEFVTAFPALAAEGVLLPKDLERLRTSRPLSRFHPRFSKSDIWMLPDTEEGSPATLPVLEISIPIQHGESKKLAGVAQFLFDGADIADELGALDSHLAWQALTAFCGSGGIVVLVLGFAFRRLQRAHDLLAERTRSLLQANQELTLAAKTAAIGAVTSHLIHGLKNPLSGLQQFMSTRGQAPEADRDGDWALAVSSARRMQTLINEVVRVLREQDGDSEYDITLGELADLMLRKMAPLAKQAAVELQTELTADGALTNRTANLILLIVENLVQNAIQATPQGGRVTLAIAAKDDGVTFEVRDQGPGIREEAAAMLFRPCVSSKEGGSGIGLAISKQLANYLSAELELKSNSAKGCTFALTVPISVVETRTGVATLK